jgi:lysyl-tRNA synthetase class 2
MATLQDYRNERLKKLEQIKLLGINPYPAKSHRTHSNADVSSNFDELEDKEVTVVGRIKNIRKMGKIGFIVLEDASGQLQLFLRDEALTSENRENSELKFSEVGLLDTGDFIEATGPVIKTKTGEISVQPIKLKLLTKALRPMPLGHEEFSDKEQRLRRRYIDLSVNKEIRERFIRRSKFWQATREFLLQEGFVEINIPVLEHTTGGADANPFVTHMDALGQDFYLRISHELPLKRLLGGGFEKVFDIGPRFRNENYSDEHLPEHVAMESYAAYQDYEQGMDLYERMIKYVAKETWGKLKFSNVNGFEVDLDQPWPRINYADIMRDEFGVDVFNPDLDQLKKILKENNVELDGDVNVNRALDNVWKLIRRKSAGPFWLIHEPVEISPLAKSDPDDPRVTQRFHPVIGGSELGNGFSELNDPLDQLNRFVEQQNLRDAGDDEAMMLDIDFVEMLEYGMPPACGWGNSERNFWFFEGVSAREGVIFPNLRMDVDETTKKIYPEVKFNEHKKSTDKTLNSKNKDLPESAIDHGTKKLYLEDWSALKFNAEVISCDQLEDGSLSLILDQTAFYPGGGGQPCDLGSTTWDGGELSLSKVVKDKDGIVSHIGELKGDAPKEGQKVEGSIDSDRRNLNSRLHCAGHLIDYGIMKAGLKWESGMGSHFPRATYVRYKGEIDPEDYEDVSKQIEDNINNYVKAGGKVGAKLVPSKDAHKFSEYIPQPVLDSYQNVNLACYPDSFNICCGGTHVEDISEIGEVKITKLKKKGGEIKVSYEVV